MLLNWGHHDTQGQRRESLVVPFQKPALFVTYLHKFSDTPTHPQIKPFHRCPTPSSVPTLCHNTMSFSDQTHVFNITQADRFVTWLSFFFFFFFPLLPSRPRSYSGGAAKEGGEWRQGVLVFCSQWGEKAGYRWARREAEVRRRPPAGPWTSGEVRSWTFFAAYMVGNREFNTTSHKFWHTFSWNVNILSLLLSTL